MYSFLVSQLESFTDTEECSPSFEKEVHYCHAFDVFKACVRSSGFDLTERARCTRYQGGRVFNATGLKDRIVHSNYLCRWALMETRGQVRARSKTRATLLVTVTASTAAAFTTTAEAGILTATRLAGYSTLLTAVAFQPQLTLYQESLQRRTQPQLWPQF